MREVVENLRRHSVDLKKRFEYDFSFNEKIFDAEEILKFENAKDIYHKNIILKEVLEAKYRVVRNQSELDFWVINKWGGINSFKDTERNKQKIISFKDEISHKRSMLVSSFDTISSLSKIASFMYPEDFVIYDARVIFSLNWLIYSVNVSSKPKKYFPIPNGRNSKLSQYDMKTIINIGHNVQNKNDESKLYFSKKDAYFSYCKFIKENVEEIMGIGAKPYELEMLLFVIADVEIFKEISKLSFNLTKK